jgi:hypothetical protein
MTAEGNNKKSRHKVIKAAEQDFDLGKVFHTKEQEVGFLGPNAPQKVVRSRIAREITHDLNV